jgi:hypothetical protein
VSRRRAFTRWIGHCTICSSSTMSPIPQRPNVYGRHRPRDRRGVLVDLRLQGGGAVRACSESASQLLSFPGAREGFGAAMAGVMAILSKSQRHSVIRLKKLTIM